MQASLTVGRRWLQFRLPTLLIFITVFGIWLGFRANRAHQQCDAVDAIRSHGGEVWYDYQIGANGHDDPKAEPTSPRWLRSLIGIDYFHDVVRVRLKATDADTVARIICSWELWA